MSDLLHCPAVLALELVPGSLPAQRSLDRAAAEAIGGLLAADLQRLLPGAEAAHLAAAGALFDPAQVLRPGFPLFADLGDLATRALPPAAAPQVIAFGSHAGSMPSDALQPSTALGAGPLLLLPFSLFGPAATLAPLGARMEQEFLARGEAGTALADALMRRFGLRLEHARYLTRHDLCALTCVQLEHAGFAAAWEVLEAALLAPESTQTALSARGRRWRYADGAAHTASPAYAAWRADQGAQVATEEAAHAWAGALFELRQTLALFAAHALPVRYDGGEEVAGGVIATHAAAEAALPAPHLVAHEAAGLGTVAVCAVQAAGTQVRLLAEAIPLRPGAAAALSGELAARYGCAATPQALGRVLLDPAAATLTVPSDALH